MNRAWFWRVAFLVSGVMMIAGGPRHPSPRLDLPFAESTAVMLANPEWVPSHVLMLASYLFLLAGLALWRGGAELPERARLWSGLALVGCALAVVEMAFHTAAVVDVDRLNAGEATPILTAHLWLVPLVNPFLAITLAAVALQGARLGVLGSRWIAWMVVLGGSIYGAASIWVVLTEDQRVSPLFAIGVSLMAFWFILVAVWPVRVPEAAAGERRAAPELDPVGTPNG